MQFNSYQNFKKIDMPLHTCNPSTEVRQEDHKFEASLGCIKMTLSQKKKKTNKNKNPSTIYLSCSKEHTDPKIHVGMQET
jgi:hypothetical protein